MLGQMLYYGLPVYADLQKDFVDELSSSYRLLVQRFVQYLI
jgi:hypothetical protein